MFIYASSEKLEIFRVFWAKFKVIHGHFPHFNEICQGHDLLFKGHIYNIHHWEFHFTHSSQ